MLPEPPLDACWWVCTYGHRWSRSVCLCLQVSLVCGGAQRHVHVCCIYLTEGFHISGNMGADVGCLVHLQVGSQCWAWECVGSEHCCVLPRAGLCGSIPVCAG